MLRRTGASLFWPEVVEVFVQPFSQAKWDQMKTNRIGVDVLVGGSELMTAQASPGDIGVGDRGKEFPLCLQLQYLGAKKDDADHRK